VLSDNGSAYVSHLWRDSCADLGIKHKRTRPRRPQANGKVERLHRTLADGWAYLLTAVRPASGPDPTAASPHRELASPGGGPAEGPAAGSTLHSRTVNK
jgi:transposase InsO family protein